MGAIIFLLNVYKEVKDELQEATLIKPFSKGFSFLLVSMYIE